VLSRGDSKKTDLLLKPEQLVAALSPKAEPRAPVRPSARDLALPGLRFQRPGEPAPEPAPAPHPVQSPIPSFFAPTLAAITDRIRQGLVAEPQKLLQLNPTRREAVARHLEVLAGTHGVAAGLKQEGLKAWIESRHLEFASQALSRYFGEVALFCLEQSILLKAWSDRGVRQWRREDLQDLNAALHGALRPQIPVDRDGWQFTRPNLYSWFKLPGEIQDLIWKEFSHWRIVDEGPELLVTMAQRLRGSSPAEVALYDEQIHRILWRVLLRTNSPDPQRGGRPPLAFSPTLREGSVVRSGPHPMGWYGFESDAFSLFLAEFSLLWWGPSAPPFWAPGSGMDGLARDQLALNLGLSAKPSLQQRIAEMEACDYAWVCEEEIVRGQARSQAANRLREEVDANPVLKRIRSGGTSRGHLQACVAISKLRPGGQMWWLREEPLHASDGAEALQFLLDRGRLIAEWDLTDVQLLFPVTPMARHLPRSLSLWARDSDVQARHAHQPLRIRVKGQLRSHVEIEPLLEDLMRPLSDDSAQVTRPGWRVFVQKSPQPQREWANHWPDPVGQEALELLERIRAGTRPMGSIATVRPAESQSARLRSSLMLEGNQRGFLLRQKERRLVCEPLSWGRPSEEDAHGFVVLLGDDSLSAPIRSYLESELTSFWLDQKAEIRGGRWVLREQDIKMLPVPAALLSHGARSSEDGFALPLPGEWEQLASQLTVRPRAVFEALQRLEGNAGPGSLAIRTEIQVRAARILDDLRFSQSRLSGSVTTEGRVIWRNLIRSCDSCEVGPITLHPEISVLSPQGPVPLQTPLVRIQRSSQGQWMVQLSTEVGASVILQFGNRTVFEVVADQIEALQHPTWSEIVEQVRAPRRVELIEHRAAEILRASGEQKLMIAELESILAANQRSLIG
jgi:hypothetical protein